MSHYDIIEQHNKISSQSFLPKLNKLNDIDII